MMYEFKRAVHVDGKDYTRGNHEVSDQSAISADFMYFVGLGYVVEAEIPKPVPQLSIKEKADLLLGKLEAMKPKEEPVELALPDEPEVKEKSKKKKKG